MKERRRPLWPLSLFAGIFAGAVVGLLLFVLMHLNLKDKQVTSKSLERGIKDGGLYPVRLILPKEPGQIVPLAYEGRIKDVASATIVLRELLGKAYSEDVEYAMHLLFRKLEVGEFPEIFNILNQDLKREKGSRNQEMAVHSLCNVWSEREPEGLLNYALQGVLDRDFELYAVKQAFWGLAALNTVNAINKAQEKELEKYLPDLHLVFTEVFTNAKDADGLAIWLRSLSADFWPESRRKLIAPFVALAILDLPLAVDLLKSDRANFLESKNFTEILNQLGTKDPTLAFKIALETLPPERWPLAMDKLRLSKNYTLQKIETFIEGIDVSRQQQARWAIYRSLARSNPDEIFSALSDINPIHSQVARGVLGTALATIVKDAPDQFADLMEDYGSLLLNMDNELVSYIERGGYEKALESVMNHTPELLNSFIRLSSYLHGELTSEKSIRNLFKMDTKYFSPEMRSYLAKTLFTGQGTKHYEMLLGLISEGALKDLKVDPKSFFQGWLDAAPDSITQYIVDNSLQEHPVIRSAYLLELTKRSPESALDWIIAHEDEDMRYKLMEEVINKGELNLSHEDKLSYIAKTVETEDKQVELAEGILYEIVRERPTEAVEIVEGMEPSPWREGYLNALALYYLEKAGESASNEDYQYAASFIMLKSELDWDLLGDVYDQWSHNDSKSASQWLDERLSFSEKAIKYIKDEP